MKKVLIVIIFLFYYLCAHSQTDTTLIYQNAQLRPLTESQEASVNIYPVPVRDNILNISSNREISSIKITNIIGQDIYRANYDNSQFILKITLDNPVRGMYLVAITFSDRTRLVRKILIEGAK
jgi:hypothetical protein